MTHRSGFDGSASDGDIDEVRILDADTVVTAVDPVSGLPLTEQTVLVFAHRSSGFVDAFGRRSPDEVIAEMAAREFSAEATRSNRSDDPFSVPRGTELTPSLELPGAEVWGPAISVAV